MRLDVQQPGRRVQLRLAASQRELQEVPKSVRAEKAEGYNKAAGEKASELTVEARMREENRISRAVWREK